MIENVHPGDPSPALTLVYTISSLPSFILINTRCAPKYLAKGWKNAMVNESSVWWGRETIKQVNITKRGHG